MLDGLTHCAAPDGPPGGVAFHPWRELLAWGGPDGEVQVWDPEHDLTQPVAGIMVEGQVTKLAWHPVGESLAVATSTGMVACLQVA